MTVPSLVEQCHRQAWAQRRTVVGVAALIGAALCAATAPPVSAQSTPDEAAERFHRSIGLLRWSVTGETLHPKALQLIHQRVSAVVELDRRGVVLRETFAGADRATFDSWSHREVFERLMAGTEARMRGLVEVLATNEYRVIGSVAETATRAHVVVETKPYASGEVPIRLQVVTVELYDGRWLVVEAEELEAIRTAVMAVPSGRG